MNGLNEEETLPAGVYDPKVTPEQPTIFNWKTKSYEQYYNKTDSTTTYRGMGYIEQLLQLLRLVADGDLISKSHRDQLYSHGLIIRIEGWQIISEKGIRYLTDLGIIKP